MAIDKVSLVDRGANGKTFAVLKRDEEDAMAGAAATADETPAGIAAWLRKAADALLGRTDPEPVAKVMTFAERVAGQELRDALYDSWYTLEDALWGAIYGYDADGKELSTEAKKALIGQSLDEFKAYLLAQMDSGISKRDGGPAEAATRAVNAVVAKVGKKISGSRLERLSAAAEALNGVLAEVAEAVADDEAETAEEDNVEKADLLAAMSEALAPVIKSNEALAERLDKIEKADDEEPEKAATLEDVVEVVGKLADRVEAIEKARGERTSVAGQDAGEPVKKSQWAGVF
jgi:hypothetical protein